MQNATRTCAEFEAGQARAREFARDQTRARDQARARDQTRARSQARVVHDSRLLRVGRRTVKGDANYRKRFRLLRLFSKSGECTRVRRSDGQNKRKRKTFPKKERLKKSVVTSCLITVQKSQNTSAMMLIKKNTSPLHRDRHARPAVRFQPGQRPRHEPVPAAFVEDLIEKKEMSVPYGQSVGGMWLLGNTHLLPVSSPPQVVRVYVNLAAVPELFPLFGKVMKINRRLR